MNHARGDDALRFANRFDFKRILLPDLQVLIVCIEMIYAFSSGNLKWEAKFGKSSPLNNPISVDNGGSSLLEVYHELRI